MEDVPMKVTVSGPGERSTIPMSQGTRADHNGDDDEAKEIPGANPEGNKKGW